jgi:hypothetical protein
MATKYGSDQAGITEYGLMMKSITAIGTEIIIIIIEGIAGLTTVDTMVVMAEDIVNF